MKSLNTDASIIKGSIVSGLRESGFFTCLPWVKEQFIAKLGIDPYPGTLNLEVSGVDLARWQEIKKRKGIAITPGAPGFCAAECFTVLLGGKLKGALVIPLVPGYPETKLELIAPVKIMDALALKDGDVIEVRVL